MKLINKTFKFTYNAIHLVKNVNKNQVLQHLFKNFKIIKYDLNNK